MAEIDFEKVKSIRQSVKLLTHGYIRECRILLPINSYYNIPELVHFMILLCYNNVDCFSINNDTIFHYKQNEHGNYLHILGTQTIERKYTVEHEWKIKPNNSFIGVFGIVDDTNNGSQTLKRKSTIYMNPNVVIVGSRYGGGYCGSLFGKTD
eukprot:398571_1